MFEHPDGSKAQWIRIVDVVAIGPLMVWGGIRAGGLLGGTLALFGAATIAFNGYNFVAKSA